MTHIAGVRNDRIRSYAPFLPPLQHFRMGGSSISGLAFPEAGSAGFTEEWDNIAIISNLSTRSLQCISIQRNSDGAVVSELKEDLLTSTDSRFYPVDIEFGPDGCLYIADFYYHHVNRGEVQTETLNQERTRGSI